MKVRLAFGLLVAAVGCSRVNPEGKPPPVVETPVVVVEPWRTSAVEAIRSLGKIDSGLEIGLSYNQIYPMIVDAKAVVNEAAHSLPDGEIKDRLLQAMEAYEDMEKVWNAKIKLPDGHIGKAGGYGGVYPSVWERHKARMDPKDNWRVEYDDALQYLMKLAHENLEWARLKLK